MKIDSVAAALVLLFPHLVSSKVADRSRLVQHRQDTGKVSHYQDNGRPIEGQAYRAARGDTEDRALHQYRSKKAPPAAKPVAWQMPQPQTPALTEDEFERQLSSQLSGCCYSYQKYSASNLCSLYGNDCESGSTSSHDSNEEDCSANGLSFIGLSFSVNTANGNPYSYQLCDQFPMEHIIDRDYEYVMSMDEDGWLVGGGYKQFDYSGKMP
jgi:hypothetical protein